MQGSRGDSIELQGRLQMKKPGRAHHDAPQWLCLGGAADASVNLLTGRKTDRPTEQHTDRDDTAVKKTTLLFGVSKKTR